MIDEHDDLDAPEDFEKEEHRATRPSIKEIWDNNPPLKIVAVVLALVVGLGIYMFMATNDGPESKVRIGARASQVPGMADVDPAYKKAMEDANKADAASKANAGLSHVDIPVGPPNTGGLKVPQTPESPRSDVLEEWKRVADAGRMKAAKEAVDEENQAPAPEVVPVVQPIRPQEVKADPNLSKRLSEQMRTILAAQTPPKSAHLGITTEDSPYNVMKKDKALQDKLASASGAGTAAGRGGAAGTTAVGESKIIEAAGSIIYAQLLTTLNSDLPGPVLAQVLSGPFSGGRMIGKLSANQLCQCLVIEYKTVVKDTVSYKIDAVALDENTTLAGINATDVNNHYLTRYVLPAAASFLTGYSQALSQTGQTQTATSGVGTETAQPAPSPKQSIFAGLTTASQSIGNDLNQAANRPPTIIVAEGTTMGVFFTDAVTTKDAAK